MGLFNAVDIRWDARNPNHDLHESTTFGVKTQYKSIYHEGILLAVAEPQFLDVNGIPIDSSNGNGDFRVANVTVPFYVNNRQSKSLGIGAVGVWLITPPPALERTQCVRLTHGSQKERVIGAVTVKNNIYFHLEATFPAMPKPEHIAFGVDVNRLFTFNFIFWTLWDLRSKVSS